MWCDSSSSVPPCSLLECTGRVWRWHLALREHAFRQRSYSLGCNLEPSSLRCVVGESQQMYHVRCSYPSTYPHFWRAALIRRSISAPAPPRVPHTAPPSSAAGHPASRLPACRCCTAARRPVPPRPHHALCGAFLTGAPCSCGCRRAASLVAHEGATSHAHAHRHALRRARALPGTHRRRAPRLPLLGLAPAGRVRLPRSPRRRCWPRARRPFTKLLRANSVRAACIRGGSGRSCCGSSNSGSESTTGGHATAWVLATRHCGTCSNCADGNRGRLSAALDVPAVGSSAHNCPLAWRFPRGVSRHHSLTRPGYCLSSHSRHGRHRRRIIDASDVIGGGLTNGAASRGAVSTRRPATLHCRCAPAAPPRAALGGHHCYLLLHRDPRRRYDHGAREDGRRRHNTALRRGRGTASGGADAAFRATRRATVPTANAVAAAGFTAAPASLTTTAFAAILRPCAHALTAAGHFSLSIPLCRLLRGPLRGPPLPLLCLHRRLLCVARRHGGPVRRRATSPG